MAALNYTNIGTGLAASARSLSFTPTSSQASTSAMIRVRAMDSGAWIQAEDTSNSTFTIKAAAGTLTVGSPNGGENWQVGTAYNVTWTSTGDTSTWNYQNVALSTDGGANYTNIGTGLAASARSLSFTPTSSQASTSAMIRVRAMDSGAWIQAEDTSNSTFTIKAAAGTLTVGSPNGGENWQVGTAYNVTWTSTGDTSTWNYQNVALSTDGGANYTNIGTGLAASARSLSFTPTSSQASTSAMIRVRAMDASAYIQAADTSNSTFTIQDSTLTTVELQGVPYINQVYDTPDDFTGYNHACNATAALMAIEYYGKLPPNPITVTAEEHTHQTTVPIFREYIHTTGTLITRPLRLYGTPQMPDSMADSDTSYKITQAVHRKGVRASVNTSPITA